MRHHALAVLSAVLLGAPALAQPIDREFPQKEVIEIVAWGADVRLTLEEGARPGLRARAVSIAGGEEIEVDGPVVELRETASTLRIERAATLTEARLRVELTIDVRQPVIVRGRNLAVTVVGPPVDFEELAMLRSLAQEEAAEELPAPPWSELTLEIEDSQAELFGLSGALLRGRNSSFVSHQSANELQVEVDGGRAEIEQHRGLLTMRVQAGGEILVRDAMGKFDLEAHDGKFEINGAEGQIDAVLEKTEARFFAWSGLATVETVGGILDLSAFQAGVHRAEIVARRAEVNVSAMEEGTLNLEQEGGTLRVRESGARIKLRSTLQARVELEELTGAVQAVGEDTRLRAESVAGFDVELVDSRLDLREAANLRLTATGSQISAYDVDRLGEASLTGTTADFELERGTHGEIRVQGESRATVTLERPCFVLPPRGTRFDGLLGLDVSGCVAGADTEPRERDDSERDDSPRSMFTAVLGEDSELMVRGM